MPMPMTRSRSVQMWFAAVAFVVVVAIVSGAAVTVTTGALFIVLALAPPVIVLLTWPGDRPLTPSEVTHGADRRSSGRRSRGR